MPSEECFLTEHVCGQSDRAAWWVTKIHFAGAGALAQSVKSLPGEQQSTKRLAVAADSHKLGSEETRGPQGLTAQPLLLNH